MYVAHKLHHHWDFVSVKKVTKQNEVERGVESPKIAG